MRRRLRKTNYNDSESAKATETGASGSGDIPTARTFELFLNIKKLPNISVFLVIKISSKTAHALHGVTTVFIYSEL